MAKTKNYYKEEIENQRKCEFIISTFCRRDFLPFKKFEQWQK